MSKKRQFVKLYLDLVDGHITEWQHGPPNFIYYAPLGSWYRHHGLKVIKGEFRWRVIRVKNNMLELDVPMKIGNKLD